MAHWRDNGRIVYEHFRKCIACARRRAAERPQEPGRHDTLFKLLGRAFAGDNAGLIDYLRSGQEFYLPAGACNALSNYLEEEPWKPRPGKPRDEKARWACTRAKEIYEAWRAANKKAGISDWGMRDEMKDESCRYGIDVAGPFMDGPPDFETVRQLMDRPTRRQKTFKRRPNKRVIRT